MNANQPVGNYWIRANPNGTQGFEGGINSAILHYVHADETSEPNTPKVAPKNPLVETNLIPLENPGAPGKPKLGGVDVAINLDVNFVSSLLSHLVLFLKTPTHS